MDKTINAVKNFFASLLDISFKEFITDKVVKVLYTLAALYIFASCLVMFFASFKLGVGQAFLTLLYSIVKFVVLLMLARAFLEIVIVLFRISDNIDILVGRSPRTQPVDIIIDAEAEPVTEAGEIKDSDDVSQEQ